MTLTFRLFMFAAQSVQDLYDRFAEVRKDLAGPVTQRHKFPLLGRVATCGREI